MWQRAAAIFLSVAGGEAIGGKGIEWVMAAIDERLATEIFGLLYGAPGRRGVNLGTVGCVRSFQLEQKEVKKKVSIIVTH